jgi:deferrochelatase/peroxidase EfeB
VPRKPDHARKPTPAGRLSRRALLASSALGAAGLAVSSGPQARAAVASPGERASVEPFAGPHQAGIASPRPSSLVLAAFDVRSAGSSGLATLLEDWTGAIRDLAAGRLASPADSGETIGLGPANLTVTVGFGPSLFDHPFGLGGRRPAALEPLPTFPGNDLSPLSGGDIVVQACADSELVAAHAMRQLTRLATGTAALRWIESGFAPPAPPAPGPPRNPLGFIDGTGNPAVGSRAFRSTVWVAHGDSPPWLVDGTFLCYRRIRIDVRAWDALDRAGQQAVIGRAKLSGAPLSGGGLHSPLNLAARRANGHLAIPVDSHVRLGAPDLNDGATMFRRSFAYENGLDAATGVADTGLLFIAWVADPTAHFTPVLTKLAHLDRLNRFTTHTSSGMWAVPPAPGAGGWLGQGLFG